MFSCLGISTEKSDEVGSSRFGILIDMDQEEGTGESQILTRIMIKDEL